MFTLFPNDQFPLNRHLSPGDIPRVFVQTTTFTSNSKQGLEFVGLSDYDITPPQSPANDSWVCYLHLKVPIFTFKHGKGNKLKTEHRNNSPGSWHR